MQGRSPGIWIAVALVLAALIVALSIPRRPSPAEKPSLPEGEKVFRPDAKRPVPGSAQAPTEHPGPPSVRAPEPGANTPIVTPGVVGAPAAAPPRDPAVSAPAPPAPGELPATAASRNDAVQALDNLHFALRDYRAALGGNPVGTNQEITAALLGDNLKQVRLDLPEGSRANGNGEMCDPWGTPYFFHQVSADKMEIRSAGPDRVMWTGDDVEM